MRPTGLRALEVALRQTLKVRPSATEASRNELAHIVGDGELLRLRVRSTRGSKSDIEHGQ